MNTIEQPINLNELDKLAKLLASENITVQHSNASTAYFDTDKRLLMLPMWKNMSKTLYHMLTLHEVGHALYTDPVAWKAAILDTPKIKNILNVLEDARIERLVKDKYPGSRYDFRVGYKQLFDQNFFGLADKKVSALSLGDRINVHYKLGDHIAVPFSEVEQSIIAEIDALSTFNDVVILAKRLLDNASKDDKAQASDQGKQASPSGEGEEASQSDGEGDGDGEEASQSGEGEEASQTGEGEEFVLLAVKRRHQQREQHPKNAEPKGEHIGDDHVIEIDERGADQTRDKHPAHGRDRGRKRQPAREKEPGGEQFDQRIAKRKRPAAAAGPAAQEQPGKHGDVVAPGDRPAAAAMRAGRDDGFLRRHAVNDDVEKTPDHGPEDRDGRGEKPRQLGGKFGVGGKVHRR